MGSRPQTSLKLSLRLPPTIDGDGAAKALKRLLEADPPYHANVRFDGESGVGWAALEDGTLGVTIYNPSIDEADMGINTRYPWNLGCQELATSYDLQTVILHENGHVVGLDHSSDTNAVMYPSYQQADCTLGQDDINGIRSIYG